MFGGHHIGPFNKYITYDTQTLFAERRGKFLRFQGGEKEGGGGVNDNLQDVKKL